MSDLITQLKADHPLRDYVESMLGAPYKRNRNFNTHLCFDHDENTPSLQIFEDRFKCFGCGVSGDIFDFIQAHQKVDLKAAIEMLQGSQPIQQREHRTVQPKRAYDQTWLKQRALAATNNFEVALPYMESRAVAASVALNSWVGATEYKNTVHLWNGESFTFKCQRFTLPNRFQGNVRNIIARLDEDSCWAQIGNYQQEIALIREHHRRKTKKELSAFDVLHLMFGAKYHYTGSMEIYNQDILYRNGVLRPLTYMLVTEGKQIDVMALLTAGFPAVGTPWKRGLPIRESFKEIRTVYYISDNDNAGRVRAEWFVKELGRGEIIHPPSGFKDADEVAIAGELEAWLNGKYNIPPLLEVCRT